VRRLAPRIPLFGCLVPADQAGKRGQGRFPQQMGYELDAAEDMLEGRLEKEVTPRSATG